MVGRRATQPAARLGACLAAAVAVGCAPQTPAEIGARAPTVVDGVLTACVAETPRLATVEDGEWVGYDVEALQAVADLLALGLAVEEAPFDTLVSGEAVNTGRCDIAAAGIVPDGDVELLVTTTAPYRVVDRLVVAPVARVGDDPTAMRVGVEDGGPAADALPRLDAAEIVPLPSLVDLLRVAAAGDVDAVLVPGLEVPRVEDELGPVDIVARVPTGDRTVMVLPRGVDEELASVVDEALTAFATGPDGEAAARRWLDR